MRRPVRPHGQSSVARKGCATSRGPPPSHRHSARGRGGRGAQTVGSGSHTPGPGHCQAQLWPSPQPVGGAVLSGSVWVPPPNAGGLGTEAVCHPWCPVCGAHLQVRVETRARSRRRRAGHVPKAEPHAQQAGLPRPDLGQTHRKSAVKEPVLLRAVPPGFRGPGPGWEALAGRSQSVRLQTGPDRKARKGGGTAAGPKHPAPSLAGRRQDLSDSQQREEPHRNSDGSSASGRVHTFPG